jgi:hypothetical protein
MYRGRVPEPGDVVRVCVVSRWRDAVVVKVTAKRVTLDTGVTVDAEGVNVSQGYQGWVTLDDELGRRWRALLYAFSQVSASHLQIFGPTVPEELIARMEAIAADVGEVWPQVQAAHNAYVRERGNRA